MSQDFNIAAIKGLSEADAAARLITEGYNELPSSIHRSFWAIVFEVVREPMFLLLLACGGLYLVLGDVEEAMMLLGFVFVVMGITLYQERKTTRALEALRNLASPRANVIRSGRPRRIPGRELVRDDIIMLAEGDGVPADGALLYASNLSVNESLLTGESVPVRKAASPVTGSTVTGSAAADKMGRPGGDDLPFVFSGTLIVKGQGVARVLGTGLSTEMGRIGKALQALEPEETRLQAETRRLVRNLAIFGLSLCAVVVVLYGATRGSWTDGLLAGITLAMATLPEEFPVVLTIFLALGAWRLSQSRVLTRHVPAIETLGSATVLCVDKTGTLTENRMSVSSVFAAGTFLDVDALAGERLPEEFHEVVEFGVLASQRDPFDPMEKALRQLGVDYLARTEHIHDDWGLVREYPLSTELLALSHVWQSPDGADYVIATKGAPEAIADLCHFDAAALAGLSTDVGAMADEGLRVLGVAKAHFRKAELPRAQHDFRFEFLGLVGLKDPIRPTVPDAVEECYAAGIRVVMITGDYPGTAECIAREIGFSRSEAVITGPELDAMDDPTLEGRIGSVNIFARVVPEQKLRIVNALKAIGEVVAMTGDGVNDAPALKAAHIGVAMGARGTDVAREASDLVLLDDDFSSIVEAVKMGRRIFDNLRKAMAYIFAVHVPIAGMSLVPVIMGWPLVLLPVHIVFLELIIDPACSIVFEAEGPEAHIMRRRPRDPRERLFNWRMVFLGLLQGVSVLAIVLTVFMVARHVVTEDDARALTFTTLIIANLGLILTNRSWASTVFRTIRRPNAAFWWVTFGALAMLPLLLYVPFLRALFKFSALHPIDLVICLAGGIVSVLWFEIVKMVGLAAPWARRLVDGPPSDAARS